MRRAIYIILGALLVSCSTTKINTGLINDQAPIMVYKTAADYFNKVPVRLNERKDRIVSYPAPADLYHDGALALPVRLKKGYLLDTRGISANTAFTSYTYEEYAEMDAAPSLQELYDHILEKNPFEALYNCGNKSNYKDLVKELNRKISTGLPGCTSIIE